MDKEIDALLDKAEPITITVEKQNLFHKIGLLPKQKVIELKPLPYGVFCQIADVFSQSEDFKGNTIKDICVFIKENRQIVTLAVAYAVNRSESKPNKRLLQFIDTNINPESLTAIILFILTQMQLGNFTNAIGLLTKRMIADSDPEAN